MSKVLFFDIDGTLLDKDLKIPEGVLKELKRLQEIGYYTFIASGRPLAYIPDEILNGNFDGYILCNGGHVELNKDMISEERIESEMIRDLIEVLEANDCEYNFETATDCYIDSRFVEFLNFFRGCNINNDKLKVDFDLDDVINRTLKIEVNTDKKEIIEDYIKDKFYYDSHGTANSFEICNKKISKAYGVQKVLDKLNISHEDSYAFGDGLNDIQMIEYVGHGIAMGNACDELKAIADEVIGHVDENGLENYLKMLK